MNMKKCISGILVSIIILTTLVGCGGSQPPPIELVPQSSNLIAQIQIGELLNDKELINAYNRASKGIDEPQTVEEALDEVSQESGLNLYDFSQILLFGDINDMEGSEVGYIGIIAQGTFDEKQFTQNIENKTDSQLYSSDYKGYKIYTNHSDDYSVVFLDSSLLVFGTEQAVKDSIDIHKGEQKPLTGSIIDTYNRLGDASINVAFILPAEARDALSEEDTAGAPISMESFSNMDLFGMSFDKESQNLTIKIDLHFSDSDSVQDAKDTLSGFITLMKGMMPDLETKNLLGKIDFTASGSWLNISLLTTISELEALSKSMTNN